MLSDFRFCDLFSGIGGFHLGLSQIGGKCVFASDIDEDANLTYYKNFKFNPSGNIKEIESTDIPDFEILTAGFPCQSFSNVGPRGGLQDPRGALIFDVLRILNDKKPNAFIIENVRGLKSIDKGKTLSLILNELDTIGYNVFHEILNATDYGLPQLRNRLFIIGIRKELGKEFVFPKRWDRLLYTLDEVMGGKVSREYAFTIRIGGRRSGINNRFNWDAYNVDGKVRYISPDECKLLQGFPDDFILTGNQNKQYKQVGNSVPVTIVKSIGKELKKLKII